MRALTDSYENRVLIGEIGDDHPYDHAREYTKGDQHLHTTYNTHMMSGTEKELTEDMIRLPLTDYFKTNKLDKLAKYNTELGWPSWAFSNHDVVRAASRWYKLYDHSPDLAALLMVLLGCLPGTIFMYQGEELGLPEAKIPLDRIQDPWSKETLPEWQGRDGCRTPMVWDNTKPNTGFSEAKPWLPIPESHKNLDVAVQCDNSASVLHQVSSFYKWRKNRGEFLNINFEVKDASHSKIIHIIRYNKTSETHCIFNIFNENLSYFEKKFTPFSFFITGYND